MDNENDISAPEASKVSLHLERSKIKHFNEISGYLPGTTLQYDNDRAHVQRLKLPAINIGIFGSIGAGKSCFINSVHSVLSGEYADHAGENRMPSTKEVESQCLNTGTTVERVKIRVGQRICLVDNRGFPKKSGDGVAEEVVKQCDGTRKFGSIVPTNWNNGNWQKVKDSICGCFRRRSLKQRIHCAVLVYSLEDDEEPAEFKAIIDALRKACGRFPLIVLTFANQVNPDILNRRWSQFQSLHCPRIFAINNYNLQNFAPVFETDKTIIDILHNCCIVADQNFLQIMEDSSGTCC